jgi:hypothetical protein
MDWRRGKVKGRAVFGGRNWKVSHRKLAGLGDWQIPLKTVYNFLNSVFLIRTTDTVEHQILTNVLSHER